MINKTLLFPLLRIQSHSRECEAMQEFIFDHAFEKGYNIDMDDVGNLYIVKGVSDTYPCVVAHMDTVHFVTKHGIEVAEFVGNPNIVFGMNPNTHRLTGIGGDDKCGIYAALHCLEVLPACKVAFFVDEEIGCVGSSQADMSFFENCRFVLQADRRGNDDFVNDICGPLSSKQFMADVKPIISSYGYSFTKGMMTDVQSLRDNNVGISVANMSAGYYNPHSESEYIDLEDLATVCNMMVDICENMQDVYKFKYTRPVYKYTPSSHTRMTTTPPPPRYNSNQKYEEWWMHVDDHGNLYHPVEEEEEEEANQSIEQEYYEGVTEVFDTETIMVGGQKKNISSMTDSEWEAFEKECEERNPPHNPLVITEVRTVF